jgi:hypothetical protein
MSVPEAYEDSHEILMIQSTRTSKDSMNRVTLTKI